MKVSKFFAGRPTLSKGMQYLIQSLMEIDFPWEIEIAGQFRQPDKFQKNGFIFQR